MVSLNSLVVAYSGGEVRRQFNVRFTARVRHFLEHRDRPRLG